MSRSTDRRLSSRPFARRVLAGLATVALALLSTTFAVSPAYADGDLKGSLVDQLGQPVLGLEFEVWSTTGVVVGTPTSDAVTGEFVLPALPTGGYYYWVHDGALDDGGDAYALKSVGFHIGAGDTDLGALELRRYVDVTGTITNWTAAMGDLDVQLKTENGGYWGTVASTDSTGASFTLSTPLNTADYTLFFQLESGSTAPYLNAYLGGEFFDPADAQMVPATAGTPLSGITMAMPDAAIISGRVTDADTGDGIPDIWVSTEDRPDYYSYDETQTDADGYYTLRAIPGLTYAVYADDDNSVYRSMTYQNLHPCGCAFTPVEPTYADPATGIDFELIEETDGVFLAGLLLDDDVSSGDPFDDVRVHLYKPVTGGWTEIDVAQSDSGGDFDMLLPGFGSYRVRFELAGVWLRVIDGYAAEGSAWDPDPLSAGCFINTGALDADSVSSGVAFFIIAGLEQAGGCGPQPAPSGSGGTGGPSTSGHGRDQTVYAANDSLSATPTPTPTPTSSPSPSSSPSASPSSSPSPEPTPPVETAPLDFSWVWWLLGLLILGIVIIVIVMVRRR